MSLPNAVSPMSSNEISAAPIPSGLGGRPNDAPEHAGSDDSFVDRRRGRGGKGSSERRQFGSSHEGLSEAGRELALAIDQYKLEHHRRYITCDEMLHVITTLGYSK